LSDQLQTIEQKRIEKAEVRLQRAVDHAKALETVQRVFTGIEKAILCLIPESYDTGPAITVARSLKQAIKENDTARIEEAEDHFSNELYLWHLSLTTRDQAIQAYHLRRFCERHDVHLDSKVFEALARFYRGLPHSELAQSKYDFAVTRFFANVGENDQRELRFEGKRLVEAVAKMFESWGEDRKLPSATPDEIAAAVDGFHEFMVEANTQINEFEGLISSGLFNRMRLFKRVMGELSYVPEVTAAAIECNVVVANKFSSLLAGEGEQIREAPAVVRDLADILSDTTVNGSASETFDETQLAELDQQAESNERLSQLLRLLRLSNSYETSPSEVGAQGDAAAVDDESDAVPAELPLTLSSLAEEAENKELIAEFLRTRLSEERQSLDPVNFLAPLAEPLSDDDYEEREVRRTSLSLILWAEKLLRFKLISNDQIDDRTEVELSEILAKMQQTDSALRGLISDARAGSHLHSVDQLLHISNHLLGSRLKLQSVLVQRAGELARQKLSTPRIEIQPPAPPIKLILPKFGKRQVLAIAATIVLIASAGVVFRSVNDRSSAAIARRDKEVQMLNLADLPGSEMLINARTRKELLVGVVSRKWKMATDEEKTQELQALLRFGKPIGVQTVMLVDSSGAQMGSASESSVVLE